MSAAPSKTQLVLARVVLGLSLALLVLGLVMHGLSVEVVTRIWHNLLDRPGGPFVFRFVLQPVMAALAALRDGLQDATHRAHALLPRPCSPIRRSAALGWTRR